MSSPFGTNNSTARYLGAGGTNGSVTVTYATPQTALDLLWGTVDRDLGRNNVSITVDGMQSLDRKSSLRCKRKDLALSRTGPRTFTLKFWVSGRSTQLHLRIRERLLRICARSWRVGSTRAGDLGHDASRVRGPWLRVPSITTQGVVRLKQQRYEFEEGRRLAAFFFGAHRCALFLGACERAPWRSKNSPQASQ